MTGRRPGRWGLGFREEARKHALFPRSIGYLDASWSGLTPHARSGRDVAEPEPVASSFEIELSGTLSGTPGQVWSLLQDHELVAAWLGAGVNGARVRTAATKAPGQIELLIDDPSSLLRRIDVTLELEPARLDIETRFRLRALCHPRRFSGLLTPLLRVRAQILLHQAVRELRTAIASRFSGARRATPPLTEPMGWRAPAAGGTRLSL